MNKHLKNTDDLGKPTPEEDQTEHVSYDESDTELSYSGAGDDAAYAPSEDDLYDETEEAPPVRAGKYRFFTFLIFVITAGGLFLGLIAKFADWIAPSFYHGLPGFLNNSLIGYVWAQIYGLVKNFHSVFSGGFVHILENVFYLGLAAVACVAVIVTLVCFIVSLVSGKKAKGAAGLSGGFALLAYTVLAIGAYCFNSRHAETLKLACIDVPVTMIVGLLLFVMIIYAIAENGVKGLCGAGAYLFTIAALFALFYPSSLTETNLSLLASFKAQMFYNISFLVTLALLIINLAVTSLALAKNSGGVMRCILHALQFVAVLLLVAAGSRLSGKWSADFFTGSALLPSLILIISTLGGLLLALLVRFVDHRERVAEEEEDEETYLDYETEVAEAEEAKEPEHTEELLAYPAETPEESGEEVPAEAAERAEPAAVAEPVGETESAPMSDFEKEMLSLADGEEPAPKAAEPLSAPAYAPAYPPAPAYRPVPVYSDPSTQYTYDPFINELSPEEKDEFGDLFIACKSGKFSDLPVYHIGGDNTEFFDKVWIRYGMYDMSPSLKDKIFSYLRRYKVNR